MPAKRLPTVLELNEREPHSAQAGPVLQRLLALLFEHGLDTKWDTERLDRLGGILTEARLLPDQWPAADEPHVPEPPTNTPTSVRHRRPNAMRIRRQASEGDAVIIVLRSELLSLLFKADHALDGDSNDDEHDALVSVRTDIATFVEDAGRRGGLASFDYRGRFNRDIADDSS